MSSILSRFGIHKAYDIADDFKRLRRATLNSTPKFFGLDIEDRSSRVWGLISEVGYPEAILSCVAGEGGYASIYISNGLTILGAGNSSEVASTVGELVEMTTDLLSSMTKVDRYPLPEHGFVRFYALAGDGVYSTAIREQRLLKGDHRFSPLYFKAHELIERIQADHNLSAPESLAPFTDPEPS